MNSYALKDIIEISKDGEWGESEPIGDSIEMLCIRGTDFDSVRQGLYWFSGKWTESVFC